jgi:hypothetical protein
VPYARTAIAVNAFAVNPFIGLIIRPLGQKDNAETISAVLDDVVGGVGGDVVHVSIPHGPFLLLGRTNIGAVTRSSGPHYLFGSRPYFLRSYQKILLINYY